MNNLHPNVLVNLTGQNLFTVLIDGSVVALPSWEGVRASFLEMSPIPTKHPLHLTCGLVQCVEPPIAPTILNGFPVGMAGRYAVVDKDVAKFIVDEKRHIGVGIASCDGGNDPTHARPLTVWRWI
jgi:hypothetical protein